MTRYRRQTNYSARHRTDPPAWNTSLVRKLAAVVCGVSLVAVSVVGVAASPKKQFTTPQPHTVIVEEPAPRLLQGPIVQIAQRTPLIDAEELSALYSQLDLALYTAQDAESRAEEMNAKVSELQAQISNMNVQLFNVTNDLIAAKEQVALITGQLDDLTERLLALEAEEAPVVEPTPPADPVDPGAIEVQ